MATRGRPTKYTPETVDEITKAIHEGATQDDAARLAGVCPAIFYRWLTQPTKIDFLEKVQKAHAEFKQQQIKAIRAAGIRAKKNASGEVVGTEGQWQANAWLLERKYPDEFGQKMTMRLQPDWITKLAKVGLTPGEAMEQLIQEIEADDVRNE